MAAEISAIGPICFAQRELVSEPIARDADDQDRLVEKQVGQKAHQRAHLWPVEPARRQANVEQALPL